MQGFIVRIALGVFGLLTVAMLLLAAFNDKGALQVRARSQELAAMDAENRKVEAENQQLSRENEALRTDPATIEKLAREELKLVKPREVILASPEK